jgi:hypothetical protein
VSVQSGVREPALQRREQTLNFIDPGMYQHELSRWLTAAQVGLLQSIQRPAMAYASAFKWANSPCRIASKSRA